METSGHPDPLEGFFLGKPFRNAPEDRHILAGPFYPQLPLVRQFQVFDVVLGGAALLPGMLNKLISA